MKIIILGIEYNVIEKTPEWIKKEINKMFNSPLSDYGFVDFMNKSIYIDKNLPNDVKFELLLHEVDHVICDLLCLSIDEYENNTTEKGFNEYGVYKQSQFSVYSQNNWLKNPFEKRKINAKKYS